MVNPVGPAMFKAALADTPREAFNWRLAFSVICFSIMGMGRGLDEGLISTTVAQKSFISEFDLTTSPTRSKAELASRIGNITAMVQIGNVGGALIAFIASDRLGRLWATRQLCTVWIIGVIVYITANGNYGQVLAGRFVMGLGIGQSTVVAPAYLAEAAPRSIRGLCICMFSGFFVYLGIMLGQFANYGTSLHVSNSSSTQWIGPTIMHLVFASIVLIMSVFALESPRWLAKAGRNEQAASTLSKLRKLPADHAYVQGELADIHEELDREREATGVGFLAILKELFTLKANKYRIWLCLTCHLLSQWSGAQSITLYAPTFFSLLGTTGSTERLLATAVLGVVKFVSSIICGFFLVDFIGRKRSLSLGITLQFISMLYIAIYLTAVPTITDKDVAQPSSVKHAGTGAIVFIYISGFGWALGWNSIQFIIGAEIFPIRVRAVATSMIMSFHYATQYGNSKAVPLMLLDSALSPKGTFWLFAVITLMGLAFITFFLPETAGKSLESMDEMFNLPWYIIGRKGAALTARRGSVAEPHAVGDVENGDLNSNASLREAGKNER